MTFEAGMGRTDLFVCSTLGKQECLTYHFIKGLTRLHEKFNILYELKWLFWKSDYLVNQESSTSDTLHLSAVHRPNFETENTVSRNKCKEAIA